jgi:DNA-directed RNA polymerase subunit F
LDKKVEPESKLIEFIKNFTALNTKDAKELKSDLTNLDLMKLKDEQIIKIIDVLPANSEDLNKILSGVSLDENETKKILDAIKKFN